MAPEGIPQRALALRRARGALAGALVLAKDRPRAVLAFGEADMDERLGGGLSLGVWHEIGGEGLEGETAAAPGAFAAALAAGVVAHAASSGVTVAWIGRRDDLYGPGLAQFGLAVDRLILIKAPDEAGVLAAMEEAARAAGIAAVVGEAAAIDLVAGRRLQLACEARGATAFLVRRRPFGGPSPGQGRLARAGQPPPAGECPRRRANRGQRSRDWARHAGASFLSAAAAAGRGRGSWRRAMPRFLCAWSPDWAIANWRRRHPCASPAEGARSRPPSPLPLSITRRGPGGWRRSTPPARRRAWRSARRRPTPSLFVPSCGWRRPSLRRTPATSWLSATGRRGFLRRWPSIRPTVCSSTSPASPICGGARRPCSPTCRARLAKAGFGARAAAAGPWAPPGRWRISRPRRRRSPSRTRPWPAWPPCRSQAPAARGGRSRPARPTGPFHHRPSRRHAPRRNSPAVSAPASSAALDQALGRAPESLAFRRPPTPWFARLVFAEPISAPADLAPAAAEAWRGCAPSWKAKARARGGSRSPFIGWTARPKAGGGAFPARP